MRNAKAHFGGVFLSRIMEELPRERQVELLSLAKEGLKKDGILILEETNPEHPFFLGSHAPSPRYLAFLARWCGFKSVDFLGLYPAPYARRGCEDILNQYRVYSVLAF